MASQTKVRSISSLASECKKLFQDCVPEGSEALMAQATVTCLFKDFEAWCFNLGVFAAPTASLDQTLRYSDEIRDAVRQLFLILRLNLEFIYVNELPKDVSITTPRPTDRGYDYVRRLEGRVEEALEAIAAVLQTLDRLGATIRKYSASSLSSRLKSFSEQENDEDYRSLATNIVAFKYPTAPSSLQIQLVEAMADRRQRLRYIRQHQQKTTPKDPQGSKMRKNHDPDLHNNEPDHSGPDRPSLKIRTAVLRNQGASQARDSTPSQDIETTPSTTAWTFRPATSAMERVRRDMSKSVISSSGASTTRMVGDLNDYPEPPTHDQWSQDPTCPTCWRQLKKSELRGNKWRRHVDTDFEPYICISEDCRKPLQFFTDLSLWENHMRNKHSANWTQLVHKPTIWICDYEHDDEEFHDHEAFQEHLHTQHSDLNEAERKAFTTAMERVEARPKHICLFKSETDQLAELAKHIAGHLRCLAFHALDHLDSDQESVSEENTETTSAKERSRSCPPSGLKELNDVSIGFGTDDDLKSVSTFDELRTSQDETISDDEASPQIVSILPKFEEDWEGIRERRPTEEETIFHGMMAYSLWDRAYDSLKKTDPRLVDRYEIMLSEELIKDPEDGSKQFINLFRDADIHKRRSLLKKIADSLLEQMRDTFQSNQVTERVTPALDWIIESSMGFPEACLPRIGFFLSIIFLSNVETRGGGDWRGYIILMSRLLWLSEFERSTRSFSMVPTRDRAKVLVNLEQSFLRLCRKILELQIRAAVPYGQFYGLEGLLTECKRLDSEFMDQVSAAGINIEMTPVQNGRQWSAATMLELITALGPVDEKVRLWGDSFEIDPRNVKDTIEKARGGRFGSIPCWVLDHQSFLQLQDDPETRLLWVRGPPATGKTTLLCNMIDHLAAKLKVVPYFFCRATDPNLNNGTAILRGLLNLFAIARPSLIYRYDLLQKLRDGHMSTWESISELFSTILADPRLRGTILVVDALDECLTDRDSLLELIKKPSYIKWIVSSRNSPEIMEGLSDASKVTLELESHED
ncbi:hypothetical protein CDV36_013840 [Fusarium kuroshium]|uniref:NACHT domain-containing protein n=1 Tax=Fusarium kuroshium TaxID=2010991 RepID=A0A3M2RMP6_9HYPO|nr:hypothetical protein CDV36_013840 [Fusarium kuroshium]